MNTLAVFLLGLAVLIPTALSIKCYQCSNNDGNCKDNDKECPSSSLFKFDRCLKLKVGEKVSKSCSTQSLCDLMKYCDKLDDCTAKCCSGDSCNASSTVTPTIIVTALATLMSMAAFLM